MRLAPSIALFCGLALACSSESRTGGSGGGGGGGSPKDTGPGDNLDGGMSADAGPDAGPGRPDTGLPPMCNPVTGGDCGNQTCFYVGGGINGPQCRDLAMTTVPTGMPCNAQLNDCEAGATCLQLQGDPNPVCHKVCNWGGNGAECAGQMMGGQPYQCRFNLNGTYGLCQPGLAGCVPYMDTCAMDQTCQVQPNNMLSCIPAGTGTLGQNCQMTGCVKGLMCINLGDGPKCYKPCDPRNAMTSCMGMGVCSGELNAGGTSLGFGVCNPSCNPLTVDADCMAGQNCEAFQNGTQCVREGANSTGMPCGGMSGGCRRGSVCLALNAGAATCYQVCDPAGMTGMACPMGTMCGMLQGINGWGVCAN